MPQRSTTFGAPCSNASDVLPGRACREFMDGFSLLKLEAERIPDFERLSEQLTKLTGWRVVAVPSLVPDDVFFDHLANRRFPAGQFIRKSEQLDYIEEPDVFHDVFAMCRCSPIPCSPITCRPTQGGQRAQSEFGALKNLARLYWYTVEFGLIQNAEGLRIYGFRHRIEQRGVGVCGPKSFAQPYCLRPGESDAHGVPHRRFPGILFRHFIFPAIVRRDLQGLCAALQEAGERSGL